MPLNQSRLTVEVLWLVFCSAVHRKLRIASQRSVLTGTLTFIMFYFSLLCHVHVELKMIIVFCCPPKWPFSLDIPLRGSLPDRWSPFIEKVHSHKKIKDVTLKL